ncbi:antitoxin Xre/MbcA/ParS toxin-binding domain-containing protein [Sphingomonas sp. NIC1]|uniref:antitoxin Xre/MbcA/ParS toxin-binding domain-containing protein n=1 Tax=Sphingomonas sp. NIC1 TaxID=1961362 RepID=UPI0018658798|nr:antitoxin Xre/MbcA/ParS toxin-binding domain-containing protein [Sphingomonas sp. NIC1]
MRIMIEVGYRIRLAECLLHDWLRTPTPDLGWLTPLDAMSGTLADLRGFRRIVEMGFAS